jgi:hypothetical protein
MPCLQENGQNEKAKRRGTRRKKGKTSHLAISVFEDVALEEEKFAD